MSNTVISSYVANMPHVRRALVQCDCGGFPHGRHCAAVEAGTEEYLWQCPDCGQHAGNCPHPYPDPTIRPNGGDPAEPKAD